MKATVTGGHAGGDVPQVSGTQYVIPDWLSPARVIALSAPQLTRVTLLPGIETRLCNPNPRRVAIIFICPNIDAVGFTLAPVPGSAVGGIALAQGGNFFLASLSDWVSLCCGAWVGLQPTGTVVQVIEMVRT